MLVLSVQPPTKGVTTVSGSSSHFLHAGQTLFEAEVLPLCIGTLPANEARRLEEQPANLLWLSGRHQTRPIHTQAECCMPI